MKTFRIKKEKEIQDTENTENTRYRNSQYEDLIMLRERKKASNVLERLTRGRRVSLYIEEGKTRKKPQPDNRPILSLPLAENTENRESTSLLLSPSFDTPFSRIFFSI